MRDDPELAIARSHARRLDRFEKDQERKRGIPQPPAAFWRRGVSKRGASKRPMAKRQSAPTAKRKRQKVPNSVPISAPLKRAKPVSVGDKAGAPKKKPHVRKARRSRAAPGDDKGLGPAAKVAHRRSKVRSLLERVLGDERVALAGKVEAAIFAEHSSSKRSDGAPPKHSDGARPPQGAHARRKYQAEREAKQELLKKTEPQGSESLEENPNGDSLDVPAYARHARMLVGELRVGGKGCIMTRLVTGAVSPEQLVKMNYLELAPEGLKRQRAAEQANAAQAAMLHQAVGSPTSDYRCKRCSSTKCLRLVHGQRGNFSKAEIWGSKNDDDTHATVTCTSCGHEWDVIVG